jgi:hypothetical protein
MAFVDHEFALLSVGRREARRQSEVVPAPARRVRRRVSGSGGEPRRPRLALVLRIGSVKPAVSTVRRPEPRPGR